MLAKRFGACIYLAGFLLIVIRFAAADNTRDTVIMKNGDHFTCNVKKLGNGILYGCRLCFRVHWPGLVAGKEMVTPAPFQVALDNGNRVEGVNEKVPLEEAPGKDFEVHEANGEVRVASPVCN